MLCMWDTLRSWKITSWKEKSYLNQTNECNAKSCIVCFSNQRKATAVWISALSQRPNSIYFRQNNEKHVVEENILPRKDKLQTCNLTMPYLTAKERSAYIVGKSDDTR